MENLPLRENKQGKEKENRPMNKKKLAIKPYYGAEIELNNY